MSEGLEALRARYPIPEIMPDVPMDYTRSEPTGWCSGENRQLFARVCNDQTRVIIDGGSFLGLSAWWFLRTAPNATIICIDHWKGSREHQRGAMAGKLPTLYETFLCNLWEWRTRIIPVRADSVAGMQEVAALGIEPDVVYIDWSHDAESVCRDLTTAIKCFPQATVIGDDWTWDSVRKGVQLATEPRGISVENFRTCYRLNLQ